MTNWKSPRCGQACWDEIRQHEAERDALFKRLVAGKVKDETAWLIEVMGDNETPTYHQLVHDDDWTFDANKALRFARREDAQAYIDHIGWTVPKPVEHMWCDPSPSVTRPNRSSEAT